MAVVQTWFGQDLQKAVKVNHIDGNLFSHNGNGNSIGVRVYNDGEPVTLTGTVSGYVITSDGSTVPCVGARSGNEATITIPPAAYQPGNAFITIFLTDGSTVTTLCAAQTTVLQARTGSQVSPGSVVTDWTQTINAAMQSVEESAENLGGIIATPYASLTYPVPFGKYTYYNSNLYRCISPIETSEEFTAAHWTQVKLGDDVSDLKSAIDGVTENTENLWPFGEIGPFTKTSGYLWLDSPLENGKTYTFYADVVSDDTYSNDCRVYLARSSTASSSSTYFLIDRGLHKRATFTVPDDSDNYNGFILYASRTSSQSEGDTATFSNIMLFKGDISVEEYIPIKTAIDRVARNAIEKIYNINGPIKWLAVGDSITFGVYSTVENGAVVEKVGTGWVQRLAESLNYELTTMASRGMGYTATIDGSDPENPSGSRISLDTLLSRCEALTDDFNLITIAFGTNDYSTPSKSTEETISAGLSDAITRLATKWKNARIIVITPFNKCSTNSGTLATKWDCNVVRSQNNLSLHDIAEIIQTISGNYGVECINVTDASCLNVINIGKDLSDDKRLLPDRTHPSIDGHNLIAQYMAHYLIS